MQDYLKKSAIHVLLIPLFFCIHKLNEFFGLLPIQSLLVLLFFGLTLSVVLFLCGKIIFKNSLKAGYWASVLLILFFFFGFGRHLLQLLHLPAFFTSYRFLLPVIFFLIAWLTWSTKKRKTFPLRATLFLNSVFLIFTVLDTGIIVYKIMSGAERKNNLAHRNGPLPIRLQKMNQAVYPDIFFIVFDEYASSESLKKYLHFDNSKLDSIVSSNHFYISKQSKANYNSTPHSIASTLDLDYFNLPIENELTDNKNMALALYSVKHSRLPKILEANGYEIINRGFFNLDKHPVKGNIFFSMAFLDNMLSETLWGRIRNEIWWHVLVRFPVLMEDNKTEKETTGRNYNNYKSVLQELKTQSDRPKFVVGHFLLPHGAFFVDNLGQKRKVTLQDHTVWRDSLYLNQLMYANTWIDTLVKAADQNFKRPRVVIIEGDHGYRELSYKGNYSREKQFMNLNLYYFSNYNYSSLYDSISPVNTFRVVLNNYFGTKLPLVKDSSVFLY